MDMAAVESLSHSELISMLEEDVRSAEPSDPTEPRQTRLRSDHMASSSGASSNGFSLSDSSGDQVDEKETSRRSLSSAFYSEDEEAQRRRERSVEITAL